MISSAPGEESDARGVLIPLGEFGARVIEMRASVFLMKSYKVLSPTLVRSLTVRLFDNKVLYPKRTMYMTCATQV
jgi:hypothetical protein